MTPLENHHEFRALILNLDLRRSEYALAEGIWYQSWSRWLPELSSNAVGTSLHFLVAKYFHLTTNSNVAMHNQLLGEQLE